MALDAMREDAASAPEQGAKDAALVRGLRERTPEAAQQLCQRFGPMLFTFAVTHFPGERETAQDIMIQSLADAARNIAHYDARKASFRVWLYRVARAQIASERRRRARRKAVPAAAQTSFECLSEGLAGPDAADQIASQLEAQRQVAALATAVSEIEFQVLVLHSLGGLGATEIGQRYWPVGASRPLTPTPGENESPRKVAPR